MPNPDPFPLPPGQVALVVIDMQRDFLLPGGFGETLGNDVSQLAAVVPPLQRVLAAARAAGLMIIHTREGHRPDLSDLPPAKHRRGQAVAADRRPRAVRPDPDPRASTATTSSTSSRPIAGEIVIDKPGKGAFYAHRPAGDPARRRHHQPDRHRRDHRGLRAHHRPRGQRPRLRGAGARRTASAPTSPSSSASAWT